jgi:hypothetical protein
MPPKREGPEWGQVRVIEELKNDPRVACIHCCPENITIENWTTAPAGAVYCANVTRIRAHCIGGEVAKKYTVSPCKCCPAAVKQLMQQKQAAIDEEAAKKQKRKAEEDAAAALASTSAQPPKRQLTLAAAFQQVSKEEVDMAWAEWAYAHGVAFHTLGSPLFQQAVTMSAKYGVSYKVPGRKMYSGGLLDKVRSCLLAGNQ